MRPHADSRRVALHTFLVALTTGSALLAAWLVVRFPRLNPAEAPAITVALLGAVVVALGVPRFIPVVGQPFGALAAIFLVALPGCTYLFLAAAWVMLYVKRAIDPYLR